MKIKDITEGVGDWLARKAGERVQRQQADDMAKVDQPPKEPAEPEQSKPAPSKGPATDIKDTLDPQMQYRFPNPEFPGTQIIVRKSGWYLDRLPAELRGKVPVDKKTKLYQILQTARIQKYNLYYNQAADAGRVKEEPASML